MAVSSKTLLEFGMHMTDVMRKSVREKAEETQLGTELGKTELSKDIVKVGDRVADEAGGRVVKDFILDENAKKVIMDDVWSTAREMVDESRKKLVLVSEDFGIKEFGDPDAEEGVFVIVDPIDGSKNLRPWKTPAPFVATSVALGNIENLDGKKGLEAVEVGVVREIFHGNAYYAVRGKGAHFEDWGEIRVSPVKSLQNAIVGIDLDATGDKFAKLENRVLALLRKCGLKRRLGASIFDFCKVASGEYDAYVSIAERLIVSDIAAAKLIVEEAGGVFEEMAVREQSDDLLFSLIKDKKQKAVDTRFDIIVSATEELHREILALL